MHYQSFVPTNQKRNFIQRLTDTALMVCAADTIEGKLMGVRQTFLQNEFLEYFINIGIKTNRNKPSLQTVRKKTVWRSHRDRHGSSTGSSGDQECIIRCSATCFAHVSISYPFTEERQATHGFDLLLWVPIHLHLLGKLSRSKP